MKRKIIIIFFITSSIVGLGILITVLFSYPLGFGGDLKTDLLIGQNGITIEEDRELATGPPGNVQLIREQGRNIIQWKGPPVALEGVSVYVIYRRCEDEWVRIGRVPAKEGENFQGYTQYAFIDEITDSCKYAVSAIGPYGKESQKAPAE